MAWRLRGPFRLGLVWRVEARLHRASARLGAARQGRRGSLGSARLGRHDRVRPDTALVWCGVARQGRQGTPSLGGSGCSTARQGEGWQGRRGQSSTGLARHDPVRPGRASQGRARQDRRGLAWRCLVGRRLAGQARRGVAGQDEIRLGEAGTARQGMARPGALHSVGLGRPRNARPAWQGAARQGTAVRCGAGPGERWRGRLGEGWPAMAWRGEPAASSGARHGRLGTAGSGRAG
jgi:hypothetical protein